MNPIEIGRGRSFKELTRYLIHDVQAETSERVGWTQSYNLDDAEPERAARLMAATAMSADRLKEAAGVSKAGQKNTKPVFHYVITWPDADNPCEKLQHIAVQESLKVLGLDKYQALAVQHKDGHPHIHVEVNLVSVEDGRIPKLSYTKKKLRQWANKFEEQHGLQITEGSRLNAQKRAQGEKVNAKRKPRNIYEQEAREGVDRRTAWMRKLQDDKKQELQTRSALMKLQHKQEWHVLKTSRDKAIKAIHARQEADIKRAIKAVKEGHKPEWRETFKTNTDEIKRFEASEQSALLKTWNVVKTYRRARKQGDNRVKSAFGALMKTERRGFVEIDNDNRKELTHQHLRRKINSQINRIKEGYKEPLDAQWRQFKSEADALSKAQKLAWKKQRGQWKTYNTQRKQAQSVITAKQQDQHRDRSRGRDFGPGHSLDYDPY